MYTVESKQLGHQLSKYKLCEWVLHAEVSLGLGPDRLIVERHMELGPGKVPAGRLVCLTCGLDYPEKTPPKDFLLFPSTGANADDSPRSGLCACCTIVVCKVEKVNFQYLQGQKQPPIITEGLYDVKTTEDQRVRGHWLRVRSKVIACALPLIHRRLEELETSLESPTLGTATGSVGNMTTTGRQPPRPTPIAELPVSKGALVGLPNLSLSLTQQPGRSTLRPTLAGAPSASAG
eukprot:CAMPEP_0118940604 /NCGR_PEP_ID=MMETSP1169-20130426/31844_1 /TAXON_ID=36882 /ORGANISM="Pyramimonas obovata, Strain CCMP722" /LENGTH=233 /DNA_ID=CAMNT_0006885137 /DNA_START=162 /DNA_END=859 /DNA_ORIENTATION=-